MSRIARILLLGSALATAAPVAGFAQGRPASASNAQKMQQNAVNDIPHCTRKLGTVSITNGDDPRGWNQYNLAPPEKLLKVLVQRSGCFNLVDRGAGLNAAATERDIGAGLGHQRGSNVGQGQIKAADYVIVAEVQASNSNSAGGGLAGVAGGLIGGRVGGIVGGIKTRKLEANTVLSLTNVRTTETVSVQDGYAVKNDVSFGAGGGLGGWGGFGGVVGGGYEDTDIGRIVTLSFIQAYTGSGPGRALQDLHRHRPAQHAQVARHQVSGDPHPAAGLHRLSHRQQGRPVVGSGRRKRQHRLGAEHQARALALDRPAPLSPSQEPGRAWSP
jgi:hypothetical protein